MSRTVWPVEENRGGAAVFRQEQELGLSLCKHQLTGLNALL